MAPRSEGDVQTGTPAEMTDRSNPEWIAALVSVGDEQARALSDLRTYLLRAALFTLRRSLHYVGHHDSSTLAQIAEECTQEAMTALLRRLDDFRGESKFTTWAYAFAVNTALTAARRERWSSIALDELLGDADVTPPPGDGSASPDPERRAVQLEMIAAIRDGIEHHLTRKQQQALQAVVFEEIPLDEVVRRWGSTRNAVYKLVHDARRKLKTHLASRGFDVQDIVDRFAVSG
jgi:RNA polymerase sigma-70 factor (ECF subfamily)